MALPCVLRNFSRYAQIFSKNSFSGVLLARSTSVLSSLKSNGLRIEPYTNSAVLKLSPICVNKAINLTQVKEFSVTSKNRSAAGHDHAKLWTAERALSAGLLGIVPVAFLFPSQAMDSVLALTMVMHTHWGVEAIVVDYVRPIIFGPVIPKIALGLTYAFSIATLVGLLYLIFTGTGLVNTIQLFWKV